MSVTSNLHSNTTVKNIQHIAFFQWCWIPLPTTPCKENASTWLSRTRSIMTANDGEIKWQKTTKVLTPIKGTTGHKHSLTTHPLELNETLWLRKRANDHFLLPISFCILHLAKFFSANYLVGWHEHRTNFSNLLFLFLVFQTQRQCLKASIFFGFQLYQLV